MTDEATKLLELTTKISALDYGHIIGPLTPENIYRSTLVFNFESRSSMQKINQLLDRWLYPMLSSPAKITPEQTDALFELAQALFKPNRHIDTDLSYLIYSALVENAELCGNTDMLIKCLYWQGLALFYLDKILFNNEILKIFTKGASFRTHYKEFGQMETRMYINRSLGNIYVNKNVLRKINGIENTLAAMVEALEFWNDPDIRAFDPEMPWDEFVYSVHQNICAMLDQLRGPYYDDKVLAERVYNSALHVDKYSKEYYKGTTTGHFVSRLEYHVLCAKYHSGRLGARETGEKLLAISQKCCKWRLFSRRCL